MQTNFNAVPDAPESRLVLAPPPEYSVAPELVTQFLRANPLPPGNSTFCEYALRRIPSNKWDKISEFLSSMCRNKLDNLLISTLSKIPLERLDLVIDFATQNNLTDSVILSALSEVKTEELYAFSETVKKHELLQKPKIWYSLINMPMQYLDEFIIFCKENQYDIKGLVGGRVFKNHPPESWPAIDAFLQRRSVSDYVINRMSNMPAEAFWNYFTFISTNNINDWEAHNILIDIEESFRQELWNFVCTYRLKIDAFKDVSSEHWPKISSFILAHISSDNLGIYHSTIKQLCVMSPTEVSEFNEFLHTREIQDFSLIDKYIPMTPVQRHYCHEFIIKYKPESHKLFYFQNLSDEAWPSFISLIENYSLSNINQLCALAEKPQEEWATFAEFIVHHNITDYWVLSKLSLISSEHFHFLRAFIQQYHINDPFVIEGLASIPSVRQWTNIYTLAQPLFAAPLLPEWRGSLMKKLYEITVQEYRIDRLMPTYDENERLARIAIVRARIENGQMPNNPNDYYREMDHILGAPADRYGYYVPRTVETGIDVHAEGRDNKTQQALQQLMNLAYDRTQINSDYEAFKTYLMQYPHEYTRLTAQYVLGMRTSQTHGHGPLSEDHIITAHDLNVSGKELLARCWHYIEHGQFIGITDPVMLSKDRENARIGLIKNLADAYEDDAVVCDPGKLQHIAIGILQGRLKNVHIDREIPIEDNLATDIIPSNEETAKLIKNTVSMSLTYFLRQYLPDVRSQAELKEHVEDWLIAHRGLEGESYQQYKEDFRKELNEYLNLSDLPKTLDASSVAENSFFAGKTPDEQNTEGNQLSKKQGSV